VWYRDDLGRKQKVSTRTSRKTEALKFLKAFKPEEISKAVRLRRSTLSQFAADYLQHSQ
jgi:hypothetical protein